MKTPPDIKLVEEALREAAWKAAHGTRDERAGKFMPSSTKAIAAKAVSPRAVRRGE